MQPAVSGSGVNVLAEKSESGIIEIIQKMVGDGESEEKILRTLKDLGVEPDKAKRLLLLGQADTFALLQSEIGKIVRTEMEKERPAMKKFIEESSGEVSEEIRQKITKAVIADLKQYEKDVTGQSKTFQEQIEETVKNVGSLSDRVKVKLNELGEAVRTVQLDMEEMKIKGVGTRNKLITTFMIVLGVAAGVADIWLLYSSFGAASTSVDSIIVMVILAMISITFLFVATVL